jgi:integrase
MRLEDITPEVVQHFVDSMNHLAPRYVRTIYGHFRSCINTAADLEIISRSPCTKRISLPRVPNERKKYFGPTDIWRIIEESNSPYKALFAILSFSGMRIGECLALKWKNVDFESGRIRIDQTWELRGIGGLDEPKTETSMRSVEMLDVLAEILQDFARGLGSINPEDFLFPAPKDPNRPRSYTGVLCANKSVIKKLGLDYHNIHSLRHSFASTAISAGLSIVTISRNLGHAHPDITLRVYAHEIEETVPRALEKVDALFREARKGV